MMEAFRAGLAHNLAPLAVGGWTVHNFVPTGTALPYIVYGYFTRREWGDKNEEGGIFLCDIHFWAGSGCFKPLMDKMDAAIIALKNFSEAGLAVGKVTIVSTPLIMETNALHGILTMEYKILEV